MPWGSQGGTLPGGYPAGGYPAGGVPCQGVPCQGGTLPGHTLLGGTLPGGTLPRGYPVGGYPAGGYPAGGVPCRGGTQLGQHREYLLHGGRYASCVYAGGLSCLQCFGYLWTNVKRQWYFMKALNSHAGKIPPRTLPSWSKCMSPFANIAFKNSALYHLLNSVLHSTQHKVHSKEDHLPNYIYLMSFFALFWCLCINLKYRCPRRKWHKNRQQKTQHKTPHSLITFFKNRALYVVKVSTS